MFENEDFMVNSQNVDLLISLISNQSNIEDFKLDMKEIPLTVYATEKLFEAYYLKKLNLREISSAMMYDAFLESEQNVDLLCTCISN